MEGDEPKTGTAYGSTGQCDCLGSGGHPEKEPLDVENRVADDAAREKERDEESG